MNILILTGQFGMGHVSCARSLRRQLLDAFPAARVELEDFPAYALPVLSRSMYRAFSALVTYGGGLFNLCHQLTRLYGPDSAPPFVGLLTDRLQALLEERRPDAVIATHPLCAQLVSRLKGDRGLCLPLITCITDVTDHPEWINRGTDCYLVPSHEVQARLVGRGVSPRQVLVTGIPVDTQFGRLPARRGGTERRLLVMGGGLGLLPRGDSFYRSLNDLPGVRTTLITGGNERLFQKLQGRYERIEVLGYTDQVARHMAQSDLIVTKPGGITLFESIFTQLPLLAWPPRLQQEKDNARWLTRQGIGWVAAQTDCAQEIGALLFDDARLAGASAAMGELRARLEEESFLRLLALVEGAKGVPA